MNRRNSTYQRSPRREPTSKELFTGGKSAEFAVFFNVAFTKLLRTIYYWQEGKIEVDENKLDTKYGSLIDTFLSNQVENDLSDEIYSKLRNYIWKGYLSERNSSGYELSLEDKRMIRMLIYKLRALRNFHSHIYHDNHELSFPEDLRNFVTRLHNEAMYAFAIKHPEEVSFYQENLLEHPLFKEQKWITQEGRTFFLCLFLTTGEVSRLLQQRRGSKQNNELKYRIKHYIYRYYAHRDGAARKYYNMEESLHDTLPDDELTDLLYAQKFYKINSQINDIPSFLYNFELFPLFVKDEQGSFWRCETVEDMVLFCQQNGLVEHLQFFYVYAKEEEDHPKEKVIRLSVIDDDTALIQLRKSDFHCVILDLLRFGEAIVVEQLRFFLNERKVILNALNETVPEAHLGYNGDTPVLLSDYEKYKLRGDRRLKEAFVEWLMAYENKVKKQDKYLTNLVKKLEDAPIELRHFDLYQEADQKPRTTDRFMEWAVEYLIDFNITPGWYWAFESFQTVAKTDAITGKLKMVLVKVVEFHNKRPESGNFRLCIDQNNILVKTSSDKTSRPFSIGEKALRNILITMIDRNMDRENSQIQLFLGKVSEDLSTIETAFLSGSTFNLANLTILDQNTLPELLLKNKNQEGNELTGENWKQKTLNRISFITESLKQKVDNQSDISRAEKNEQIMRCYQFFDWAPKFLRKNEYQQLSIFHFSLERITSLKADLKEAEKNRYDKKKKNAKREFDYYYNILDKISEENKDRIPRKINSLLERSVSLDDLFEQVIQITLNLLVQWKSRIEQGGPITEQLKIAKKLKIKTPEEGERPRHYPRHIPFNIHPILPLHFFYKKSEGLSLSKVIRSNDTLIGALRSENYQNQKYNELIQTWPNDLSRKLQKKTIGNTNDRQTHDALLWYIAGKYFSRVSPSVKMTLNGGRDAQLPANVGSLRKSVLYIPIQVTADHLVKVSLFFHQLDDGLFVESKNMLEKVVRYIYRCRDEEPEKYSEIATSELSYGEIVKMITRIQNDAIIIGKQVLLWEQGIINRMTDEDIRGREEGRSLKRISFKEVCSFASLSEEAVRVLADLRSCIFHMKIPEDFTYRSKVQDPSFRQIIGEVNFIKDTAQWE